MSEYIPSTLDIPLLGLFFGTTSDPTGSDSQPMRIMHAPSHVNQHVDSELESIYKINPLSVGRTEMDPGRTSNVPAMRRILHGYSVHTANIGPHSQEVPIGLRMDDDVTDVHSHVTQLSQDLGKGIGNDRYMTVVLFARKGSEYFHIQTHWNAGIQAKGTGAILNNDRVKAMEKAFHIMVHEASGLIAQGREGFISGDFNYRRPPIAQLWDCSPQKLYSTLGMHYHEEGIDYIGWTKGMRQSAPVRVIARGTRINQSDHPWLVGHFVRKNP